jgi:AraC-like DNA-binding protein
MINRSHKLTDMRPDVLRCEFSNSERYAMDWHAHDCHMLLLPRHGSLLLSTEGRCRTQLSCLSFSVIAPDFGHATSAVHGRESHLALYVDPEYIRHYGQNGAGIDLGAAIAAQSQWQRSDILNSILTLHDQISLKTKIENDVSHLRHRHHLNHLLFEECIRIITDNRNKQVAEKQNHNAILIRQVQTFIVENLEVHHDINTLCHEFHLSRRHLTRLFREVTQETVVDYANRRRVECAHRLICESGMSVLDAGLSVGVDSPSYLARLFRKHLGLLPRDCQKIH